MKPVLISFLFASQIMCNGQQALAANTIKLTPKVKERICQLVIAEADKIIGAELPAYSPEACVSDATIDVSEGYSPDGAEAFRIDFSSGELAEGTDLWLACELSADGPLKAKSITLEWCSVEQ